MENRGGEDDKVFRRIWEVVEAGTGEVGIVEAKGRRDKRRSREEMGKSGKKRRQKGGNSKDKKSSREMGNLG